ncbi:hypothetical protein GDO81_013418 [Engystomops pustulosus]|uniref:Androgen-dependent TFPI-regulating protein n=1 Tax=Engystomops pustulosus TaxID=76066 RepID=A0AAV7B1K7_ENGPU|nr:hypothetical protein GDO81_013418 [Engystomops pustulosus]
MVNDISASSVRNPSDPCPCTEDICLCHCVISISPRRSLTEVRQGTPYVCRRLQTSTKMAAPALVLHVSLLAWNVFAVWQNVEVTGSNLNHGANSYGGRWKYLTFLNQVLQTLFFGICVLCDLLQLCLSNRKRFCSVFARLKDCIFAALAFPVGVFVCASFWSIYAYDRELVYPKELDSFIPQWLNHAMHCFVLDWRSISLFSIFFLPLFAEHHVPPDQCAFLRRSMHRATSLRRCIHLSFRLFSLSSLHVHTNTQPKRMAMLSC